MDKAVLSRKERENLRHKQEILSAALKLFSEKGFYNVSMQQIAEEAEFAVGTLYKYFKSKDELFNKLLDNSAEQILNEFTEILNAQGNEVQRLAHFFRNMPLFHQQHKEIIKLYVSVFGIRDSGLSGMKDHRADNVHKNLNSSIAGLVKQGIDKGLFRAVDPEMASEAINSTLEAIIFDIAESDKQAEIAERFSKAEQLFLEGLLKPR